MNILGLVEINNWILLFLFIVVSYYLYSKWKLSLFKRIGIPGPPPTVFIGNSGLYKKMGVCKGDQYLVEKYGKIFGHGTNCFIGGEDSPMTMYMYPGRTHRPFASKLANVLINVRRVRVRLEPAPTGIERPCRLEHNALNILQRRLVNIYFGTFPSVALADPELVKNLLIKDFSKFPNRTSFIKIKNELKHGLNVLEGDHWRFMRSTLSATFSSGKMRKMESMLNTKCKILVDCLKRKTEGDKAFECKDTFGNYTMDCIAALGFGMDIDSQRNPNNEFVKYAKRVFSISGARRMLLWLCVLCPPVEWLLNAFGISPLNERKTMNFFKAAVTKAIEMRDESDKGKQDILQLMLNAHNDSEQSEENIGSYQEGDTTWKKRALTKDEVTGNAMLFLIAGYETTATAITFAIYSLATNPACQEKLVEEIERIVGDKSPTYDDIQKMEYLDGVLNESLRLYPPVTRTSRVAEKDCEIAGYKIPKGTDLGVPIYFLHRSAEYWSDPDKFDPERFSAANRQNRNPYTFLPFGLGPRNCIAMRLAYMEAKFAIIHVLQRYKIITCDQTEIPITLSKQGLMRPENDVYLKLQAR